MPSVERTVTTDQPLDQGVGVPVGLHATPRSGTRRRSPPPARGRRRVGTTYHNVSKLLGSEQEVDYVVTKYDVEKTFQLAGDAGSIKLLDTITFEATGTGTSVTYHAEFNPEGAAKLAEPLMPAALKVLADKVAASMQEKLDQL